MSHYEVATNNFEINKKKKKSYNPEFSQAKAYITSKKPTVSILRFGPGTV